MFNLSFLLYLVEREEHRQSEFQKFGIPFITKIKNNMRNSLISIPAIDVNLINDGQLEIF